MGFICYRKSGNCRICPHYRIDEERPVCFAKEDEKNLKETVLDILNRKMNSKEIIFRIPVKTVTEKGFSEEDIKLFADVHGIRIDEDDSHEKTMLFTSVLAARLVLDS